MGRILGIDYGSRRVGLALSDPSGTIASPLRAIKYQTIDDLIAQLKSLMGEYQINGIVVGFPIGMKGQKTEQTKAVELFIDILKDRFSVAVEIEDERLTSVEAVRSLQEQGFEPSREKGSVDATAAAIFLQAYLDRKSFRD
ncbi:MAG: Holliday junction resolvase RuvX [Candidatus Marinimicrobia bacterium]|jgi:putative Holliday junction resolvase|nr:Holliday junction resolvase RuvX [Candidatus Neomarinimicrobiota bacterium]MDP6456107.1 Holliday junction resolvase RuvX [Candidatus Neomarinimicrobiota bacterium]MDP6592891.1 Holliday junction resolvase RuvX [Candidatus Neomarinimicrobiota bacterium]MDP6836164.1 Holliday junction resolvase RuvX [Candidatus Neomarinimicrobiota bacterium]|tara:strand:- start:11123 stop:11545 length:423 start_codon:yes stop_codon:yes gene_type:complete